MPTLSTLILLLVLNLTVLSFVGYHTFHSGFEKIHKWIIYITLIISPVIGAVVFLVIQRLYRKRHENPSS